MRAPSFFKLFFTMLCMMLFYQQTIAQSQEKIYALHIMSFAKGLQWPNHHDNTNFIIGVFEYPPLIAELRNSARSIKIGNKNIEIREVSSPSEIKDFQIIFLPAYKAKSFPTILTKLADSPTLIVTNKMDLAKHGSGINFILEDGKVKYEINCNSILKRGIKIPTNIKAMGLIVE